MAADLTIDGKVSRAQAQKAFSALAAYTAKRKAEKERNELPLDGVGAGHSREDTVWLQLTVKKLSPEKKMKPCRIPVAHPLLDPRTSPVCLIVKDPQREYKDLLASQNITLISRVVGVEKLKGKFKPFEARRQLAADHELFLADERVIPLMPKLLGKIFFDAKKQPIPVNLVQRRRVKAELERAISSTYYTTNRGTCTSIKLGHLSSHTPEQLADNLATALPAIIAKVPGKWGNVQGLDVKTGSSVALPVWNCKLGSAEGGRFEGLAAGASELAEKAEGAEKEKKGAKGKAAKAKAKEVEVEARAAADDAELELEDDEDIEKTDEEDDSEEAAVSTPVKKSASPKASVAQSKREQSKEKPGKTRSSTSTAASAPKSNVKAAASPATAAKVAKLKAATAKVASPAKSKSVSPAKGASPAKSPKAKSPKAGK